MLEICNLVFVILFCIEALIKLIGFGFSCYFSNAQNSFDFFLVFVSIIGLFEQFMPINVTALRVIRGIRILRIFKSMHDLSELLVSLYYSLRSFFYVVMMTFLIMFVFSLLGMHLFNDIEVGKYGAINKDANFKTFERSIETLWVSATGGNWNMYMHDTMEATSTWAAFYWIVFIVINVHIFLNIIVAVVFEKMEERGRLQALSHNNNRYS